MNLREQNQTKRAGSKKNPHMRIFFTYVKVCRNKTRCGKVVWNDDT